MSTLKSTFSRLLSYKRLFKWGGASAKSAKLPAELATKFDIFPTLNFNIPELQLVKLSLEAGQEEKAFEQFFHYLKMRQTPMFTCSWKKRAELVQTLQEQYAEAAPNISKAAEQILRHRFLLFAKHQIQAGTPIAWNRSYEEDLSADPVIWEAGQTYTAAKLRADDRGDVQFVWALNRCQHFLDLGKAYWYTGEEELVREFITEITDWSAQNPYPLSVNWVDGYEVALRGLFWIFGYMFFFPSANVGEEFFCRFTPVLLAHGQVVYDLLQTDAKTLKPHQIAAQAAFLYLLGTMFPEYLSSKSWSTFGWSVLQGESKWLSLDQLLQTSLAALVNVIELYCLVLVVRKNNRYHLPQAMMTGLTKMLEQLALFVKPNGHLANIGEDQPFQLLKGMYGQNHDFRYLFALAAVLSKKEEFKALGETCEEPLLWILGRQGPEDFEKMAVKLPPPLSYAAPEAGYAVMRSGWEAESGYCLITNNPARAKGDAGLQHTDLLSFELFANGHELIIDSGAYSHQPNDAWNRYFCSAAAHNSVTVDKIQHLNFAERAIQSTFDHWVSTPFFDFLSGAHTGFADLEEPVTHRRSILYVKPHYWIISDVFTGEGQHVFDQYFHFPPLRINVDFVNKGVNIRIDPHRRFALMPVNPEEMDVMIFTGGDTPDSGWMSDGYKHKHEAPYIKYGKRTSVPTSFHTLLYAYAAENGLPITGHHLHVFAQGVPLLCDEASALEISTGPETHYFTLLYKDHPQVQFHDMIFSGQFLFLRKRGDAITEIMLHHATFLALGETVLFQSDAPVEGLTLQLADGTLTVLCAGNYTFQMQLPGIKQLFVNDRKAFLKYDHDRIRVSTSRV